MRSVAKKISSIGKSTQNVNSSSSIFGSAGSLSQSIQSTTSYRIGFYPFVSKEQPEMSMGIASCLCYLLEQYQHLEVYRVFAKIELDDDDEISIEDSQFTPDDWEFDGLDNNITISGYIDHNDSTYSLSILVENSFSDDSEDIRLNYEFSSLIELLNQLPGIAESIVSELKEKDSKELIISYNELGSDTESITELLHSIFDWNLDLYLYLWDVDWEDEQIESQFNEILDLSQKLDNHSFAIWCISMIAKQVMQIGLDAVGDVIVPLIDKVYEIDEDGKISLVLLSRGLVNLGYTEQAISLIEQYTAKDSTDLSVWMTLIDIYSQVGQIGKAIDTVQQAIETGIEDEGLYWRYSSLLSIAQDKDWFVEDLLLIDPDEFDEAEQIIQEIIATLENILILNPNNLHVLYSLMSYLIDTESDDMWAYFEKLVKIDTSSHYTRSIIDLMYKIVDLKPGFDILNEYMESNPENLVSYLNLAQLAVVDQNTDLALQYLKSCEELISSERNDLEVEIQRLKLSAIYLDFDQQYSEIKVILNAGRTVSEQDVEFLESAIEIAPTYGELYVTLTHCYLNWKDTEAALEVITEAQNNIGNHPRIVQTLAKILWEKGKKELAFNHLNDSLRQYPNDIQLLIQIANYLIENNQLNDSKPFLERAEIIAPSHPGLWQLRKEIGERLAQ